MRHIAKALSLVLPLLLSAAFGAPARVQSSDTNARHIIALASGWRTAMDAADQNRHTGFENVGYEDSNWQEVDVPHNWDNYHGYRQLRHGNLHGYAWYRRSFSVPPEERGRRLFLFFEGVGSCATVWVNGKQVGQHAGGLTTFTIDVTDAIRPGAENLVAVRADHPAGIRDLPWVCGGCERASGFSEGPQPLGIFRPVHLVTTATTRIEPFGVHAWIDGPQSNSVTTRVRTELKNYGTGQSAFTLVTRLLDRDGRTVVESRSPKTLPASSLLTVEQALPVVTGPNLWSPAEPYLYTLVSEIVIDGKTVDRIETPFGLRWISWPRTTNPDRRRLLVNGQPFFINGVADYEHQLGNNFAFSETQIEARVRQIESAGFNTFRDAHHPHNVRFQDYWDRDGLLWWTQFGAHIWFDNEAFRTNFKTLLREWVRERRNSPSLILWGLQNESLLPTPYAEECVAIIREMDPTASTQRLVTTCNGGTGTDWNVPQIWSGTYSGDPAKYDEDLRQQSLNGEYGAWRSLGLHSEGGFEPKGVLSEDRFRALMGTKIVLGERARDEACGHLIWPFTSHSNPGRNFGENGEQLYDGIRPLDRVGPVNNKGLFTIWGEPTDAYYLYRASYAPKDTQPMVYIVSHTWPERWTTPGKKDGILVYSNGDDVELFNGDRSLGRRAQGGRGTPFQWDDVEIDVNLLRAEARINGKVVATDATRLHFLPAATEHVETTPHPDLTAPLPGQHYLYRINCGGPDYTDRQGNQWLADSGISDRQSIGTSSWAGKFPNLPVAFASQRKIHDPIADTVDDPLYQTFRYGRDQLQFIFPVSAGDYQVELFFLEPWYGTGGGMDCTGWRVFDVAINGQTAIRNLDLWREAGRARAVKKVVDARVVDGPLVISFPRVTSGQAVISAIAISSKAARSGALNPVASLELVQAPAGFAVATHLDTGDQHYSDGDGGFTTLPYELLEADWLRTTSSAAELGGEVVAQFKLKTDAEVFVAHDDRIAAKPVWLRDWERTLLSVRSNATPDTAFTLYRKLLDKGAVVTTGANGSGGAMYTVFVRPVRPPSPPLYVALAPDCSAWSASGHAKMGVRLGRDSRSISRFPENLSDGDLIVAPDDRGTGLKFSALDHIEIFGAFQKDAPLSSGWIDAKQTARLSDGTVYTLRRQRFAANTTVSFSRVDTPAFAFVRAVRPSHSYTPKILPDGRTEWTIQVGVGDRYGLSFHYRNPDPVHPAVTATLTIVQPDGSVLRTDAVEFPSSSSSPEWAIARTRTGESINAGTYKLQLSTPSPGALTLGTLDVE